MTIKEAYQRVFEHVSINGLQTRMDVKKVRDTLIGAILFLICKWKKSKSLRFLTNYKEVHLQNGALQNGGS
jgi:hypothetical protein